MTDTDLIVRIYAVQGAGSLATAVIKPEANPSRYVAPKSIPESPRHFDRRRERESTEPLAADESLDIYEPCLELRFSHPPRTRDGFMFGSDPRSDVVLPNTLAAVSFHHFALTFDDQYRPIVRDLGSLNGTEVTYDGQGQGKRSSFAWIIGGDPVVKNVTAIIVNVHHRLKFRIDVCRHDTASRAYMDSVDRLLQGAAGAENLVGQLNLRSRPLTERTSGAHTPGTGPIALTKKLGQGGFGLVTRVWDVSTASVYALKQPSEKAIRQNRVDVESWRKEAGLLSRVSHDHIVRLLDADFTALPKLRLEYMPGGSLDGYRHLSVDACGQVLCQCLSALTYLHGLDPPIVHRDIKPGNILVQSLDAGSIHVKFGDFGLSRQTADPTTICGTSRYLPPEMYGEMDRRLGRRGKRSYTAAVDIWSLGVVVLELLPDGLPLGKDDEPSWCQKIVTKLNRDLEKAWDSLRHLLADFMVLLEPEDRGSAQTCYEMAQSIFCQGCQTPTSSTTPKQRTGQLSSSDRTVLSNHRAAEPRLSQIPGLFDPLHELGGGSALADLGSQAQGDSTCNFNDTWLAQSRNKEPHVQQAYNWDQPQGGSLHAPSAVYGPVAGGGQSFGGPGGPGREQPRTSLEAHVEGNELTESERLLAAELLALLE